MKYLLSLLFFLLLQFSSMIKLRKAANLEGHLLKFLQVTKDNFAKCKLKQGKTKNGEVCQTNEDCLSDFCQIGVLSSCQANKVEGEVCACAEECYSNKCRFNFNYYDYYCTN